MTIIPFLNRVNNLILNPIIALLFALALVYFLYGIVTFLRSDAEDKSATRTDARNAILWGMVGMLIMFSVYGIIKFILHSFDISVEPNAGQYLKL